VSGPAQNMVHAEQMGWFILLSWQLTSSGEVCGCQDDFHEYPLMLFIR
jgi:hypothetical protein